MSDIGTSFSCARSSTCDESSVHMSVTSALATAERVESYHEDDRHYRREHVLSTDWTVAVRTPFDASMLPFQLDGHANATFLHPRQLDAASWGANLAVKKVLSQASSNSAYPAVVAMIYCLH